MSSRIHYICINQNCCADVYAKDRNQKNQNLVTCPVCNQTWHPKYFRLGSWAHGREETYERNKES